MDRLQSRIHEYIHYDVGGFRQTLFAEAEDEELFYTTDAGENWVNANLHINTGTLAFSGANVYVGASNGILYFIRFG